jgi:hypothetical protein
VRRIECAAFYLNEPFTLCPRARVVLASIAVHTTLAHAQSPVAVYGAHDTSIEIGCGLHCAHGFPRLSRNRVLACLAADFGNDTEIFFNLENGFISATAFSPSRTCWALFLLQLFCIYGYLLASAADASPLWQTEIEEVVGGNFPHAPLCSPIGLRGRSDRPRCSPSARASRYVSLIDGVFTFSSLAFLFHTGVALMSLLSTDGPFGGASSENAMKGHSPVICTKP